LPGGAFFSAADWPIAVLRWLTHNVADTRRPTHADLAPLTIPLPPAEAGAAIARVVPERLARWAVVSTAPAEVKLTRTTRLFRFVDDIRLTLEPAPGGTTRVHAESKSRLGVGDLGQNRRNILELWKALRVAGVAS
jgi:uncharacterized protein (DUF1499 family)